MSISRAFVVIPPSNHDVRKHNDSSDSSHHRLVLPLTEFYINGTIWYILLCVGLLQFSIMCVVIINAMLSSVVWIYHNLFIFSPIDGHIDYFQLWLFQIMLL